MAENEDPVTQPAAPLKSLASLPDEDAENSTEYSEIFHAIGLSGDESERINLSQFRRIISENLDVDISFMYKRVFNAFDTQRNGYLTAKELVCAISVMLQGPFQSQVELGMRVYGKPSIDESDKPKSDQTEDNESSSLISSFSITRMDAILSIVESLQLSSPRARHTLTTDNREKAYHIGEDLVFIIYPKLDIDGDGIISLEDFSQACHEDPSLLQVFGQYLPRNNGVLPSPRGAEAKHTSQEIGESIRPRSSSSRSSFEGIDYLRHSPTIGTMWGRESTEGSSLAPRRSERLQPIPMVNPK